MRKSNLLLALAAATVAFAATATLRAGDETAPKSASGGSGPKVDEKLASFQKGDENVAGTLSAIGSDTMINIVTVWGEEFARFYPEAKVRVEVKIGKEPV